jgi:hypothetical protein
MTTNSTPNTHPERIVRDGESAESCFHCRYFVGHTSWCPMRDDATAAQHRIEVAESSEPVHITLGAVRRAVASNVNLSSTVEVENLGGGVWGLVDRELGLTYVMNGGQSSTDTELDGPADVSVVHEDEPDVEVAHALIRTVDAFVELVGVVEGSPALTEAPAIVTVEGLVAEALRLGHPTVAAYVAAPGRELGEVTPWTLDRAERALARHIARNRLTGDPIERNRA